jgi:hypothetical protein
MVSKADYTRVGSNTLLAKFAASLPSHPYVANPNSPLCVTHAGRRNIVEHTLLAECLFIRVVIISNNA